MACFSPLNMYRPRGGGRLVSSKSLSISGDPVIVPCGWCDGCKLGRAGAWAIRCVHEAKMHDANCFVTLTYDEQHVPQSYSVDKVAWQKFHRRVRKRLHDYRFFGNGEYGDIGLRPHYHCLFFGLDFPDKVFSRVSDTGEDCYTSELLSELWPYGLHEIGEVTLQSAGYVARYCLKKINGALADDYYYRQSPVDGEFYRVAPEFCTMSRGGAGRIVNGVRVPGMGGIGTPWFNRFASDAFPSDFLVIDGRRVKPPSFYLRKLAEREALVRPVAGVVDQTTIKRARKRFALAPSVKANNTPARLAVRAEVTRLRRERLVRSLR